MEPAIEWANSFSITANSCMSHNLQNAQFDIYEMLGWQFSRCSHMHLTWTIEICVAIDFFVLWRTEAPIHMLLQVCWL